MSPANPHPRDAEAAEYVIGATSASERRAFERDMAADPALAASTRAWEQRLSVLVDALPSVEPSPLLYGAVEGALDARAAPNVVQLREADFQRLTRSRSVWRSTAVAATAIAASLLAYLAIPQPPSGGEAGQLVAVVNRLGDLPALIVRVDPVSRVVQVRAVSTETPAGHSLELWSVAAGAAPRSLGLVRPGASRLSVPAAAGSLADGVTLAVSVEPPGGSPTGAPTGAVVYSGRLVRDPP